MKGFITLLFSLLFYLPLHAQVTAEVNLTGYNQVPPVRTAADGKVEITVVGDSLFVTGRFTDLREYYRGAYINYGREGDTGNRMFQLRADLGEDKRSGEFKKERNSFHLRPAQIDALRNGRLYVNITSNRYRGGEIRGQIPPLNP
jgi:hypothetical protein